MLVAYCLLVLMSGWTQQYLMMVQPYIKEVTFSFQDADYQHLAGYNSYEREENDLIRYSDVDVSTTVVCLD